MLIVVDVAAFPRQNGSKNGMKYNTIKDQVESARGA